MSTVKSPGGYCIRTEIRQTHNSFMKEKMHCTDILFFTKISVYIYIHTYYCDATKIVASVVMIHNRANSKPSEILEFHKNLLHVVVVVVQRERSGACWRSDKICLTLSCLKMT